MAQIDPVTGVRASRFGLYIHFPYCLSRCPYCDFAVTISRQPPEERYTKAVLGELAMRRAQAPDAPLESIFFGGGTPSLWSARWVGEVIDTIARLYGLAPDVEISLEANPEVSDAARWQDLRSAGVNRLSLGVQSFEEDILRSLGRHHDAAQARGAVAAARAAGFENVSVDLIFGVQGQKVSQVKRDAEQVVALGVNHVSAYMLTLDRESLAVEVPLAKQLARGQVQLPPDEEIVEMGRQLRETLRGGGFRRYEVSNFAKGDFGSRHNALYWTGGDYLAVGAGAVGMLHTGADAGERFFNERSTEKYLRAVEEGRLPESGRESLDAQALFSERLSMGLRLAGGVDVRPVFARAGIDFGPKLAKIEALAAHGLAHWDGARLTLTDAGLDVHSAICASLI